MVDFTIIALTIFLVIRMINRLKSKAEDPKDTAEVTPKDIELLASLEALMKEQNALLRNKKD